MKNPTSDPKNDRVTKYPAIAKMNLNNVFKNLGPAKADPD